MYLQLEHPPDKSRTASIVFYALCVLYVLSVVNVVLDLATNTIERVCDNSICNNIVFLTISCAEDIRANLHRVNRISHYDYPNYIKRLL
jgi:hypothetical protein